MNVIKPNIGETSCRFLELQGFKGDTWNAFFIGKIYLCPKSIILITFEITLEIYLTIGRLSLPFENRDD